MNRTTMVPVTAVTAVTAALLVAVGAVPARAGGDVASPVTTLAPVTFALNDGGSGTQRLELFVIGESDGSAWHVYNDEGFNFRKWSQWHRLGAAPGGRRLTGTLSVARRTDGNLALFGVDESRGVVYNRRGAAGFWGGWSSIGGRIVGSPVVGRNADGRLQVFAHGDDHRLWQNLQTEPNSDAWEGWLPVLTEPISGDPNVVNRPDGTLDVYVARRSDGRLLHTTKTGTRGFTPYASIGGPAFVGRPTLTTGLDRLPVVVVNTGARVEWGEQRRHPDGGLFWRWRALDGEARVGEPGAAANPFVDDFTVVSLTRSRGVQHRIVTPSGEMMSWEPLGGVLTNDPVVTITPEGLTHIFGRGLDGRIWVLDNCEGETAPLVWSGWRQLTAGAPPADRCRRT